MNSQTELTQLLLESMARPSEEAVYQSAFKTEMWLLREFCALMGGLSPERYKQIREEVEGNFSKVDLRQFLYANKICSQFVRQFQEVYLTEKISVVDGEFCMSAWKFIKWIAMNNIPMKEQFFKALPLYLMELYFEFRPESTILRTASKRSLTYHRALYQRNAQRLIKNSTRRLSRKEIYEHPEMQSTLQYLRKLECKCKPRTIQNFWLGKLEDLKPGRPPKNLLK